MSLLDISLVLLLGVLPAFVVGLSVLYCKRVGRLIKKTHVRNQELSSDNRSLRITCEHLEHTNTRLQEGVSLYVPENKRGQYTS
jgi:hypothetical protein